MWTSIRDEGDRQNFLLTLSRAKLSFIKPVAKLVKLGKSLVWGLYPLMLSA